MAANTPYSRKQKGASFQKEIREDLITFVGIDEKDILSTSMGKNGCDIYLSRAARGIFPYGVECKRQERFSLWEALQQASFNANLEGLAPLLVFRRNHDKAWGCLPWGEIMALVIERAALRDLNGGLHAENMRLRKEISALRKEGV